MCLELLKFSSIVLLCLIFLQNYELHTSELLLSELVALQEQLAGWLVDYVVKPGAEHNTLYVQFIDRIDRSYQTL
jgi:hypothetical protein